MVYKRWRDYKDRQLEVRLGGSFVWAGRNEIFGGGLAKATIFPKYKSYELQIDDMPLSAITVAHAEAATDLCLETSSEGATYDRLENKVAPDRTRKSTRPSSRFGHGGLTSE